MTQRPILVIDDEPTIRELVAEALDEAGYAVDTAADGAQALERLRQSPPRAIILDLMMPTVDGEGFVELARREPAFDAIPIVVMTAAYGGRALAEKLGAQACFTKPFELDELVSAIDRLVGGPPPADAEPTDFGQATRARVRE